MDSVQKQELTSLRDAFRRNRLQLESSVIKDYMADFLHDNRLRSLLMNDVSTRAVWYCLCNNNADRDLLISKLYSYFVKKGSDDKAALWLVSAVLFLGGVDSQMNLITQPKRAGQSSPSLNSLGNAGQSGISRKAQPVPSSSKNRIKWIAGLAALGAVVLLVVMISKNGGGSGEVKGDSQFSNMDLCHTYTGIIEMEGIQESVMKVTYTKEKYYVTIFPSSNQSNKKEYTAKVKGNSFKLDDGPDLTIEKAKKKTKLYCEAGRNHGKWYFESRR